MLRGIEAVIFDVDGTLLDSNSVWQTIDEEFMRERGLDFDDNFQREIDGMSFHQVAEYSKEKYKLSETPDELMDIWYNMAVDEYAENVDAKPGAYEFMSYLKDNGIKMAVATSNQHKLIDPGLSHNNIYDFIDLFYTAKNIGEGKDNPTVYLSIADKLGVKPEKCLVFDDIYPVLEAVNDAGMRSCVVLDTRSLEIYGRDSLISKADYHITDFRDIDYENNNYR